MSIKQRLDMECQYRDQESAQAQISGRLKFACCRQCGSEDGMQATYRELLAMMSETTIALLGSWYSEPGNDECLFRPCYICNWYRNIPDGWERLDTEGVLDWLDRDPMAPDHAALAAEEPVLASEDSRDSAGLEG